jgi:hypothetical protein
MARSIALALVWVAGCGGSGGTSSGSGAFFVDQYVADGEPATIISATFYVGVPLDQLLMERPGCPVLAVSGPCRALRCGAPTVRLGDAGTVSASVRGSTFLAGDLRPPGTYLEGRAGHSFSAGEIVTLAGTGGDLPPFTATIAAPEAPTVTLPATISRTADLTVTWPSTIAAELAVLSIGSMGVSVGCRLPASEGTVTVASSVASYLTPGMGSIHLSMSNQGAPVAGGFELEAFVNQSTAITATIVD